MDLVDLNLDMTNFTSSACVLKIEEQVLLRTSLPELRRENNFGEVSFWGKIFGVKSDYYVAQGRAKDYIRTKMSFYSIDGQLWRLLLAPNSKHLSKFHLVRSRFVGDPTEYHRFIDPSLYDDEEDTRELMKEEDRLSTVVYLMDAAAAIAPRGAFVLNPKGRAVRNDFFRGLSVGEAKLLSSYGHLSLIRSECAYAPEMPPFPPGGDRAIDFLEPISKDINPAGWTLHFDCSTSMVTMKNLWWPGYVFYHKANTNRFGSIYMGNGDRNDDLPFMM